MTPSNMTSPSSSCQRRDNAAQRIHKRLGIWPWDIFTSPSRVSSAPSNASSFNHRPDLYPPANIGWSIQTLENLSALAERLDQEQAQLPASSTSSASQQQAEAAEKSLLGARVSQALITAVETRIKRQTRRAKNGAAAILHTPKRPYLTCRDIKAVLAEYKAKGMVGPHTSPFMLEEEEEDGYDREEKEAREDGEGEGDSLGEQNTEEEDGDNFSDRVYEGSKDRLNTRQSSLDRFDNPTTGHCSVDKTPSLPLSPSPPAAAAAAAAVAAAVLARQDTNSQDEQADLVDVACTASLSASAHTMLFATAGANVVADANANDESPALRRHSPPEHTPPATWVWSSFVPNKRPRLSSHCSVVSPSIGRLGQLCSNDAQVNQNNNDNDTDTTHWHLADGSSERNAYQRHLRLEDPLLALDNEELSVVAPAVTAFRQQSMRLDKSAAELKATISGQRALNAGYRRNIVRAGEEFNKASILLKILRQRLASARSTVEHRASIQESLQHSLDYITNTDATDTKADSLRGIINAHKDTNNQMEAEVAQIENALASIQGNCTFFERDRATAVDRHAKGLEKLDATIAQYKAAVEKKRDWDSWITSIHMRPESLSHDRDGRVPGGRPVAAEDLEVDLGVSQVQQEAGL